jgi:hypothetical protein
MKTPWSGAFGPLPRGETRGEPGGSCQQDEDGSKEGPDGPVHDERGGGSRQEGSQGRAADDRGGRRSRCRPRLCRTPPRSTTNAIPAVAAVPAAIPDAVRAASSVATVPAIVKRMHESPAVPTPSSRTSRAPNRSAHWPAMLTETMSPT